MIRNLILSKPLAILDLETTGTDTSNDRIVEISVLKLLPEGDPIQRTRRINPERPIPPEASAVHGITDTDVANEPTFTEISARLFSFLEGCDLCGYNLERFDLILLVKEFERAGLAFNTEGRRIVDPLRIFQMKESRDLTAAMKFYCGKDHAGAHGAEADVLATLEVLEGQLAKYSDLPRSVEELSALLKDPSIVDMGGFFKRMPDGSMTLAKGRHKGKEVQSLASVSPDYFQWILNQKDILADTKSIAKAILESKVGRTDT